MRAFYFGCARGVWGRRDVGHFMYEPGGRQSDHWNSVGPFDGIDSQLAPVSRYGRLGFRGDGQNGHGDEYPNGVAALHHKDGWTALAFWDNTGDSRGNSNSNFFFDETLDFEAAVAAAREHFPELFERFNFEIVPVAGRRAA